MNHNILVKERFKDLKNYFYRVREHENSFTHKKRLLNLREYYDELEIINHEKMTETEKRNFILEKCIDKRFVLCGLFVRDHDEKLGGVNSGNFLILSELLGKFDPFIDQHLEKVVIKLTVLCTACPKLPMRKSLKLLKSR